MTTKIEKTSKYQLGWLGIIAKKKGNSKKILIKNRFIEINYLIAQGCNFIRPMVHVKSESEIKKDLAEQLKGSGFEGAIVWFSDAQWKGRGLPLTRHQWETRIEIK